MKGVVVKFNEAKGYGFIRQDDSEQDVFVHIRDVSNASVLQVGQYVNFDIEKTQKGLAAVGVIAGRQQLSPYLLYFMVAGGIWLGLLLLFLPYMHGILAHLLAINLSTLALYGFDKLIAGGQWLRVPEKVLHVFAFFGGSPAALFAQTFFRHKTLKGSFQLVYWLIVAVQVILVVVVVAKLV